MTGNNVPISLTRGSPQSCCFELSLAAQALPTYKLDVPGLICTVIDVLEAKEGPPPS